MLEAEIRRTEAAVVPEVVLADSELPGVGEDAMSLREALRLGGVRTITILGLLGALQVMDGGVFNVLAPDIQKSLDVSDAGLGAIGGATGVLFVLGAIPMSSLSDRSSRKRLIAITMSFWAVIIVLTGAVQNAFQMFLARLGAGLGQSAQLPVSAPLLVDTYPITAWARIFAMLGGAQAVGTMAAPFLAGGIAALAGGDNGWRWAFLLLGVVAFPIAVSANTIKEPRRGRHEMQSVLGEELPPEEHELPISLSVAFERLRKIQSFYYFLVGMAALGFALFTAPLFLNLYFDEELGLDAFQRGIVATDRRDPDVASRSRSWAGAADELFRRSPPGAMAFVGLLVALFGIGLVIAIWLPSIWAVVPVLAALDGLRTRGVHDPSRGRLDDHPLPAAGAWHGDDRDLRVPVRVLLRRGADRDAVRRLRHADRTRDHRAAFDADRRRAHRARRASHPSRHDDGGRGAPRGTGRTRPHAAVRRGRAGDPGPQPRLLVRQGASPLRRRVRGVRRRDARPPRNQRRGQVDAAARHQRARCRRTRRDPPTWPHRHLRGP